MQSNTAFTVGRALREIYMSAILIHKLQLYENLISSAYDLYLLTSLEFSSLDLNFQRYSIGSKCRFYKRKNDCDYYVLKFWLIRANDIPLIVGLDIDVYRTFGDIIGVFVEKKIVYFHFSTVYVLSQRIKYLSKVTYLSR